MQTDNQPKVVLSYRFRYDGIMRDVDNVTLDGDAQQFLGFEMRKSGKFSYRIKRYSLSKITELKKVEPYKRSGPRLGRPMEAGA